MKAGADLSMHACMASDTGMRYRFLGHLSLAPPATNTLEFISTCRRTCR